MTPPTTPTIIPTRGNLLEPRFEVELDDPPEDAEGVAPKILVREEVAKEDVPL